MNVTAFSYVMMAVFNTVYSWEYDECDDISYSEYVVSLGLSR
jgi:hypothetical protein